MSDNKPYVPVSCAFHSEFELLVMHNTRIRIQWHDEHGTEHIAIVKPNDLKTNSGEEFLLVADENNRPHKIRLERIISYQEV
ncbi:MAG: transcriptional antiterminator, Rof [Gammaproteobacteria bacterium]